MPYDPIIVQVKGDKTTAIVSSTGLGKSTGNSFGVVNVTGQNNIVATVVSDTLKVRQGSGILITTDSPNDTITIAASGGAATDQFARDTANGAFEQANSAALRANTLVTDNVPETSSNLYFTASRVRSNVGNTSPISYNPTTGVFGHENTTVTPTTYGNSTFVSQVTVDAKGHVTSVINVAIDTAGSAFSQAAFDKANAANSLAQTAYNAANSASLRANTLVTDNVPETTTNLYFTSARVRSNISNTTPINYNSTTGVISHSDSVVVPGSYGNSAFISQVTIDAKGHVTSASNVAIDQSFSQAAFDKANGAYNQANSAYSNANTAIYTASQIRANISNTTPINYNPTTGVISHADSGVSSTTYGNSTFVSQVTVDSRGHVTSASNVAIDQSLAQSARDHANGAFTQANSAALRANTLVTDNVPETSSNLYFTASRVRANISNTTPINYNPTTGVISHADSGATATTYGSATQIPQITIDAKGHVTSALNVAINGLPPATANGQLLIGNTVSSGFDVNTLTQGSGIVITNDKGSITIAATGGGGGGSSSNSFTTINVAGQANVVADSNNDTLVFIAGNGISIITDSTNDTITIISTISQNALPAGSIQYFSQNSIPQYDFIPANGSQNAIRTAYPELFREIGIQYGSGDGANTFGVPYVAPKFEKWIIGTSLPVGVEEHTVTTLQDGRVVVIGGQNIGAANISSNVWFGNVSGNNIVWNVGTGLPNVRYQHSTTYLSDNRLLVVGGKNASGNTVNSCYFGVISGTSITWTSGTDLPSVRSEHATAQLPNNQILVTGGFTSLQNATFGTISGDTITWDEGTPMPLERRHHTFNIITKDGGRGVIFGGRDSLGLILDSVYFASFPGGNTITWVETTPIPTGRTEHSTVILNDGHVFLSGGVGNFTTPYPYVARIDENSIIWTESTTVPTTLTDRYSHSSCILNDGRILLCGGDNGISQSIANTFIISPTIAGVRVRAGTTGSGTALPAATANGQLLVGNTVSSGFDISTLTPGSGIQIVNGKGSITISANTLVTDNVPETTTNLYFTSARVRANISNTTPINYNPTTGVISHADSAVAPTTYGTTTSVAQITIDSRGHVTSASNVAIDQSLAQTARDHANGAYAHANGSFSHANAAFNKANTAVSNTGITVNGSVLIGNTVSGGFDINTLTQGTGIVITNDKGSITIAATGGSSLDQFARDTANGAFAHANGAFIQANSAALRANTLVTDNVPETSSNLYFTSARVRSNISNTTPINYNSTTGVISHADSGVSSTTYGNTLFVSQVTIDAKGHVTSASNVAIDQSLAQTARDHANGAFVRANASISNTGVTVNGSLQIGNTVSGGYDMRTLTAGVGVTITNGKGTITIDALDQFARDRANGAYTTANGAFAHANGAFSHANAAFNTANAATPNTATTNGHIYAGNTVSGRFDLTTISQTAPIIVTNGRGTIGLSHASSGVGATTYGNASHVSQVTVDGFGHATTVTNTPIAIATSQITSGVLAVNRGGTGQSAITVNGSLLIANTVSGGYDVNTITQGSGILITNDKGSITIATSGGSSTDQFARDTANGAYAHANGAYAHANSAFNKANSAIANSGVTVNGSLQIGNTVSGGYDMRTLTAGFGVTITNGQGTITIDALDQFARDRANGAYTTANGSFAHANGAYAHANSAFNKANAATPNTATSNGQIYAGNTVSGAFDLTTIAQTAPVIVTNGKGTVTLSHASSGVGATTYGTTTSVAQVTIDAFGHVTSASNVAIDQSLAQTARDHANGAYAHANGAFVRANASISNTGVTVNGSLQIGNTVSGGYDMQTLTAGFGVTITNGKGTITIDALDQFARDRANGAYTTANGSYAHANGSFAHANGAFVKANAATPNTATANGQIYAGNTVSGAFDLTTIAQTSPIIVTNGKGTVTLSHASSGVGATTYGNAGFVPTVTVDQFGHITTASNTAISITTASVSESPGGPFYHTSARVRGNVANTTPINYDPATGIFSHALSGVTSTGYGTVNVIPVFTVSDSGHITSVVNTTISITAAQVTSGTLSVARGGTGQTATSIVNGSVLIGNTVSGGYDINTITQGSGIVITNDKGSITIAATGGAATDQFARDTANGAYAHANGAFAHANGAFIKANAAVANTGVTVNGSILIGNTVSGGYDLQTITQGSGITITNGRGTITIASTGGGSGNSFATINTISIDANTQGNLVAVGSDTLILEAGVGINISFISVNGKEISFAVNPGYIQAISSGQSLHAL